MICIGYERFDDKKDCRYYIIQESNKKIRL